MPTPRDRARLRSLAARVEAAAARRQREAAREVDPDAEVLLLRDARELRQLVGLIEREQFARAWQLIVSMEADTVDEIPASVLVFVFRLSAAPGP